MSPRERILAFGVLAVIVLAAGGFLFHQLFFLPLQDKSAGIVLLREDIKKKQARIEQVEAERPKLERYRLLSLPPDPDLARRDYEKYLTELMRQSGFAGGVTVTPRPIDTKSSPTVGNKVPIYTKLAFTVQAHANLASLVTMLEHFYHTGLLHQIRNIQIQRPATTGPQQQLGDLDINLTVEALIVNGTHGRPQLWPNIDRRFWALEAVAAMRRMPAGLALAAWVAGPAGPLGPNILAQPSRQYASIAGKNIFTGPPLVVERRDEVEVTQFVHLTDITREATKDEAFLYDRYNNRRTRLRAEPGFDSFRVLDNEGEILLQGRVVKIDSTRELIFRVDEKYYSLHVGQSLEEVLRRPLAESRLKELGIIRVTERPPATEQSSQ